MSEIRSPKLPNKFRQRSAIRAMEAEMALPPAEKTKAKLAVQPAHITYLTTALGALDRMTKKHQEALYWKAENPKDYNPVTYPKVRRLDTGRVLAGLNPHRYLTDGQTVALQAFDRMAAGIQGGDPRALEFGYIWFVRAKTRTDEICAPHPIAAFDMQLSALDLLQGERAIGALEEIGMAACPELCCAAGAIVKAAVFSPRRATDFERVCDLSANIHLFQAGVGLAQNHYDHFEEQQLSNLNGPV